MQITETDLLNARLSWGDGLIAISNAYDKDGIDRTRELASTILDDLYGFEQGEILFKPTLSGGKQTFRTEKAGTLSYFIGHNADYPQDSGFGLKSWREFNSITASSFIAGDVAMWMGWVSLTDKSGAVVAVDKSFGYKKAANGALKIVLHHSSLPYQG